jgi:prepilin-type N-terminal cleavage/methylation domain-containing protein
MPINFGATFVRSQAARAFSLVELLVVIAIVGVLVAVILPSLSQAREVARDARCKSNMRQVASASMVYRIDWGYYLPRFLTQSDSPLLGTGGPYTPARFGMTGMSLLRKSGYFEFKTGASYSSGIALSAQRNSTITLCPSGRYFGPNNSPGNMGYVLSPRTITGLDPDTRIQDGYEFSVDGAAVISYQLSARYEVARAVAGITSGNVIYPVKRIDESVPPSNRLLWAEYFYRDGLDHGYAPSLTNLRGTAPYASEPWPRYIFYRTPHGAYSSGNYSALDGHVATFKLHELQAAWTVPVADAAKQLPFVH